VIIIKTKKIRTVDKMPISKLLWIPLLAFFAFAFPVWGQHHPTSSAKVASDADLGEIDFPTSGPPEAHKHFIRGVLLLHSFEYGSARAAFVEARRLAPDFALAYWGEAMTFDHRIWGEQDQKAGLAALARLAATPDERRAKAPTLREKMYLDAVEALYGESDDPEVIAAAYSKAMEALTSNSRTILRPGHSTRYRCLGSLARPAMRKTICGPRQSLKRSTRKIRGIPGHSII
jgi:hypothetical protein